MAGQTGMRQRAPHAADVARDRMWKSMRHLRRFTRADLIATAEAGRDNVNRYVGALLKQGYLKVVQPRRSGVAGGDEGLQLVRNTGPVAPRMSTEGLYDANLADPYDTSAGKRLMKHAPALMKALRDIVDAAHGVSTGLGPLARAIAEGKRALDRHDGIGTDAPAPVVCSCPSGDGSLRWPCRVHP